MVKKQSHAATTEKSPPGKIAIPMKKLCTTEIIPSAPQNVSTPPSPQKQFDPGPLNNLNLLEKFYCHLPKYLNHPGLQPSQPNYSN